jgi:lambda repressor-like predicted transcriptional regulator
MGRDLNETVHDLMDELVHGQGGRKGAERRAEIAHERELAVIRAQSHALIWVGSTEEMRATIARWYELGWIVAESLQDAFQKASIHFRRPDGASVIVPVESAATVPAPVESRESFVKAILELKGWSVFEWATEAQVSHATAIDYLHGKTKPHPSTRQKLAKALGVPVQQLPR